MNFLNELILRLFSKTPHFFTVLKVISVIAALITGLPEWLRDSGVILPEAWMALSNSIVSYAAMAAAFIAQLTMTEDDKAKKGLR